MSGLVLEIAGTLLISLYAEAGRMLNEETHELAPTAGAPPENTITFYLHYVLGGNNPTARPVTGVLGAIYNGQVPFARPMGFFPPKGGIPIANGVNPLNGAFNLGFGTITVIDDALTETPDLSSVVLGRGQGFYVSSSEDGSSQLMAFSAVMENDEFGDSINFFGIDRISLPERQIAVIGGTGKFKNAQGYATIQTVHESDNGFQTLLKFIVYLTY
eukprot:Gb_07262 [translate_table: standard]